MNNDYEKKEMNESERTEFEGNESSYTEIKKEEVIDKSSTDIRKEAIGESESTSASNEGANTASTDEDNSSSDKASEKSSGNDEAAENTDSSASSEEGLDSEGGENPSDSSVSAASPKKKMKKSTLIALISSGAVILAGIVIALILFIPIFFADHIENTFGQLLPDVKDEEKILSTVFEEGYREELFINIEEGNLAKNSAVELHSVSYGYSENDQIKEKNSVSVTSANAKEDVEIYVDGKTLTVGGLFGEDAYASIHIDSLYQDLPESIFNPDNGSKYALDKNLYDKIMDFLNPDNKNEEHLKFLSDLFSELLDQMEKETDISFADGGFRLEREVTYKASYSKLCDMIDIAFDRFEENEDIKKLVFGESYDRSIATQYKQAFNGIGFEFSYKVRGSDFVKAEFSLEQWDKDVIELAFNPVVNNGKTIGFTLELYDPQSKNSIKYKYSTHDDGDTVYYSFVKEENKKKTELFGATYSGDGSYEIILYSGGAELFKISGIYELSTEEKHIKFTVDKFLYTGRNLLTMSLELKQDSTAKMIRTESGDNILRADEDTVDALIAGIDSETVANLVYDFTGMVLPAFSLYPPNTVDEELQNAIYSYLQYRERVGNSNYARYYSNTFDTYILMEFSGGYITYKKKPTLTSTEADRYIPLQSLPTFELHSFKLKNSKPATCTEKSLSTYQCELCGAKRNVTGENYIDHSIVTKEIENYLHDDNQLYTVTVRYCSQCEKLESFSIGEDMHVRFSMTKTGYIVGVENLDNFRMPDEVLDMFPSITNVSFAVRPTFTSVRVPDSSTQIKSWQFSNQGKTLQAIVIPQSVKRIEVNAFGDTSNLRVIFYEGTQEQWENITNGCLEAWKNVEIIFSPDGVSAEDVFLSCSRDMDEKIAAKKTLTDNIDTANLLATQYDGVEILSSIKTDGVVTTSLDGSVIVVVKDDSFYTPRNYISVYNGKDDLTPSTLEILEQVVIKDVNEKYIVGYTLQSMSLLIIDSVTCEIVYKDNIRETDRARDYRIVDVKLYGDSAYILAFGSFFVGDTYLLSYDIKEGTYARLVTSSTTGRTFLEINREEKRLAILNTGLTDNIIVIELENVAWTTSVINVKIPEEMFSCYAFMPLISSDGKLYDTKANVVGEGQYPQNNVKKGESYQLIFENAWVSAFMTVKTGDGDAYLVIVRHSDGKRIEIPYYADSGYIDDNGYIILYTDGGYGIIRIHIDDIG